MGTRREMFVIVIRWTYQLFFFVSGDFLSFLIIFTNSGYRKSAEKENNHDFWYSEIEWLTDFLWHTYFWKANYDIQILRVRTLKYRINFKNTFNKLLAGENILDSLTVVRYMIFNLSLLTLAWRWCTGFV
jgi:hypothetical protein